MKLLFLLFLIYLPINSFAEISRDKICGECVERKKALCSEECELVPTERSLNCLATCIEGYCDHRCKADAPEIKALLNTSCEECLDLAYEGSTSVCNVGSERTRAKCKLENSETRCQEKCSK